MTDPLTWQFWQQWTTAPHPSDVLLSLQHSGQLALLPELAALQETPQDPHWHPEGNVWVHTLHVCNQAADISRRDSLNPQQQEELLLAALCHDLGKPATTVFEQGRWKAPGHPAAGVPVTAQFLQKIQAPAQHIATVLPLVAEHLVHASPALGHKAIRRLLARLHPAPLTQLIRLIEADLGGRPPLPAGLPPAVKKFAAAALTVAATSPPQPPAEVPPPLILGRHLIKLGYQPAPWFKQILKTCETAQRQGAFQNENQALSWLRQLLETNTPSRQPSILPPQ
ncbi:MAG: HD domain-containing protein [Planctomyces sp.]